MDHGFEGETLDYPLRPGGRLRGISSLTIFFQDNYFVGNDDDDEEDLERSTIVTYVGIKGQGSGQKRMAVKTVYESRGVPKDHQVHGGEFGNQQFLD